MNKRISKKTPFILYGGGEVGNNCYRSLTEQGYHVAFALDKNKCGEHIINGIYTYKLGTEPKKIKKSDFIIIICLANGMIHKAVADELYGLGYVYIVFLPLNYCIPDEQKHKLLKLYNHVLLAEPEMEGKAIFEYCQYAFPNIHIENSIIRRTSKHIIVWMRAEILFSENLELWEGDKSKIFIKAEYEDRNILCAHPCEDLFDFFALKAKSSDSYFDSKKEQYSQAAKEKELGQREEVYRLFEREHQIGMNFFIDGAPQVVWNANAYCNLVGGHHRTLYLLHKGHNLFPVRMKYSDFDIWCNTDVYQELEEYIYLHQIKQFYAPLPHPGFLNFPVQWEDTERSKLADTLRFLADINLTDMTILDCSSDEGYFARNLDRVGAKKTVFLNDNLQQLELTDIFNRLLYRNNVIIKEGKVEEFRDNMKFDIIFSLGEIDVKDVDTKSHITFLGALCSQYLFMETTRPEEIIYIQKCTKFNNYTCIHREYRNGQTWELGVYRM